MKMEQEIPKLEDFLEEWRKGTPYSNWTYTRWANSPRPGNASGYLYPPRSNKRGLVQVWDTYVMIIISPDTISAFQANEYYKRYLKTMGPGNSNQWIRLEAANPEFFEILGDAMERITKDSDAPSVGESQ